MTAQANGPTRGAICTARHSDPEDSDELVLVVQHAALAAAPTTVVLSLHPGRSPVPAPLGMDLPPGTVAAGEHWVRVLPIPLHVSRITDQLGHLTPAAMQTVDAALREVLDLGP